ncbi:hypothetical protein A7U60_g3440 [Sanghuangporus baumii]|uniref:DUF6699 domain-containing protein n=1 Tax=Sanghuangporus baumii TaxID=108892 RepID=A0A9Q5I0C2_SANBA|nr:hypothetical protein A7U60_g3440 [Sanghuangporus baumii]
MQIRPSLEENLVTSPTLTSPTLIPSDPPSPSITPLSSSPIVPPYALLDTDMPSPVSNYRDPYRRFRAGSRSSSSSRDPFPQLPSPADSQSSGDRRPHDIEMAYDRVSQISPTRSRGSATPVVVPNVVQTESLEYPPQFTATRSILYPNLHFLLARDSVQVNGFFLDMWTDPQLSLSSRILDSYGTLWVTNRRRLEHVRIVSPDFPWVIDIKLDEALQGEQRGITCNDVWSQIHTELKEPIHDTDWAYLSDMAAREATARRRHEHLVGLARQRNSTGDSMPLLRLDWLMRRTMFAGLERDEGYSMAAQRLLPGREQCPETWIARFVEAD